MRTERVALRHASVALRELQGRDELALDGIDTRAAVTLLDRLIARDDLRAIDLPACDRDALLAALHRREWGDRILTTLNCTGCGERFDLSFSLRELQAHLYSGADPDVAAPTATQEMAAAEHGARAGVERLAASLGVSASDIDGAAARLECAAPILDVDVTANCAECGHAQQAHFDLQSFVLLRLRNERALLLDQIHRLASHYGWSLREISLLPRSIRQSMAHALDGARGGMQ